MNTVMNTVINTVGIDVGKRKCKTAIKDRSGQTLNEFFLAMIKME